MGWQDAPLVEDAPTGGSWQSAPVVETPKPKVVTTDDRVNALGAGFSRGVAGILGLPVDTAQNVINLVKAGIGTGAIALDRPDMAPALSPPAALSSDWFAQQAEKLGIRTTNPNPQDASSRMAFTAGVVTGGMPTRGAIAPAAGGAVAGEVAGPEYVGIGAMTPAAVGRAGGALKTAVADPATVQQNQQTFKEADTRPSVAQATEGNFFRAMENLVGRFPGGQGVIARFREKQQEQLGAHRGNTEATDAGRAIEHGLTGSGGFLDRTKATWQQMDAALAQKLGGKSLAPNNTITTLDGLTTPTVGAEKTTGALVNPTLASMRKNMADDLAANGGVMPYEALRALRTKVGSMLDDSLISGVPNGELKNVYRALSKDLGDAATTHGAKADFDRQNAFWSARQERVESILSKVLGKNKDPEAIFKAITPTDVDGVTKIRTVMKSLDPADREIVTQAIVHRLGRATPGKQNEAGDAFSSETFLTNWNRMNDGAKAQIFPDANLRRKMDAVASVSSNIREGNKPFANPSGSGGTAAAYGVGAGALGATIATGSLMPLVAAGGTMATANIGARMLTNEKVVDWLAKGSRPMSDDAKVAHLARLGVIYNETKDQALKSELSNFMPK